MGPTIKPLGDRTHADQKQTGPLLGGTWQVPDHGRPMVHINAMANNLVERGLLPAGQKSAFVQALVRTHGTPRAGQTLQLPSLNEIGAQPPSTATAAPHDRVAHDRTPKTIGTETSETRVAPEDRGGGSFNLRNQRTQQRQEVRTTAPRPRSVDVQAEALKLAEAVRRGDERAMYEVLHGKSKADQQAIIAAFDRMPIAADTEVPRVDARVTGAGGLVANWVQEQVGITTTQRNDFKSRLERMDDRTRAHIEAYLKNPSSQLEDHDKLYFCMRGWGTYEGGIKHILRRMDSEQISDCKRLYYDRYKEFKGTLERALQKELSGTDEREVMMLLRGKDNITEWHRKAFELYRYGDGQVGTEDVPIFRLLEGETAANIRRIAEAYKELGLGDLFDELDGEFDGTWFQRMEQAYQGNDAPKQTRARYVAHTARLFLRGEIDWHEMSGVLSRYVDPTGQNGPTLAGVERAFNDAGEWGDMTDRMKYRSREVHQLVQVLERGADPTSSPEAMAVQLYHMTLGDAWGTDEKGVCDLLAKTDAGTRQRIDQAFRRMYDGRTVEQAIRRDFSDSPNWMDRALEHWEKGPLPAESMVFHVSRGAGQESEAVRAISSLPAAERADFAQRYEAAHGTAARPDPAIVADKPKVTGQRQLGTNQSYDQLIERMESRYRYYGRQGKGLDSPEGRADMVALARSYGEQLRGQLGPDGLRALTGDAKLEAKIKQLLTEANHRDRRDGRIKDENLDQVAREIASQIRGNAAQFSPALEVALGNLGDRTRRAVRDQLAVAQMRDQGLDAIKNRVHDQLDRERGDGGWNAVSRALMDRFGWTGEFVDEAARDFFLEVERATTDGQLTPEGLQGIVVRYADFLHYVKEYQAEKDQVGETAGDIAGAAAAVVVSVASGGTATPLVVAIAATSAGTAKAVSEKAFKGKDYTLGSEEFWKDLAVGGVDGAVTVYTAGLSKAATGRTFLRAVVIEANAAGLGSATALGARTALDENTWEAGVGTGAERVLKNMAVGYGIGFGTGAAFTTLIRGTAAGVNKLRARGHEGRVAKVAADSVGDSHGYARELEAQLRRREPGMIMRHTGDVIDKGDAAGGSRAVIKMLRELDDQNRMRICVGNHEETLFKALANPANYDDVARARLVKDVALRRLLGKPSSNFVRSVMRHYGLSGSDELGRAVRLQLADRMEEAVRRAGSKLTAEGRDLMTDTVARLRNLDKAFHFGHMKAIGNADDTLALLVDSGAISRRDVVMLHGVVGSFEGNAEIGAKRMLLEIADNAGDVSAARNAINQAAREMGVDPSTFASQLDGIAPMMDDLRWLESRMVAFQVEPTSGALMTHGGFPYVVDDAGNTVFRPDKMIAYQRLVQSRRWLALPNGDEYNLSPAWAGESFQVNPRTAGGPKISQYDDFSFGQADVTAQTYDDAFAAFNRQLRAALDGDDEMARALGLSADDFQSLVRDKGGVRFLATGHENAHEEWISRRAARLVQLGHSDKEARKIAEKEVARIPAIEQIGDAFDRLGGRHLRMDFGLEDGNWNPYEAGGRWHFMDDGTIRMSKVSGMADGQMNVDMPAIKRLFERNALKLQHMGEIELPVNVRAREVTSLKAMLAQNGIPNDEVARVMRAFAPGLSTDDAMERFVVEFYRQVGRNEGQVLDAVTRAFTRDPTKAAVELAKPIDAFRAIASRESIPSGLSMQQLIGRNLRTAAQGVIDTPPMSRGDLIANAQRLVAQNPGSEIVERGVNSVTLKLEVNGITSNVVLQTDGINPWILVATTPDAVATASDASQGG